ncbi:MAG: acyltransferase family protein [Phycisphaeraceae bacterium]|nr:acyltransferase family protein [Phycisphaeraceae bacterium]
MPWINNARIATIFAVVFLHTAATGVNKTPPGTVPWWVMNVGDSMVRWCVPVFVMISGALLLDPNKQESLTLFYRKRLARILIPTLFWSMFYLLWLVFKSNLPGRDPVTLTDLLWRAVSGNSYYHLWFLYMLSGLYLFTPFFRKIVAQSSLTELCILTGVSMLTAATAIAFQHGKSTDPGMFASWFLFFIPYFIFGHIITRITRPPPTWLLWTLFTASSAATAIGFYYESIHGLWASGDLFSGSDYFYSYHSVTVIPMSASVVCLLQKWRRPIVSSQTAQRIALLTLGIYVIHPAILEGLAMFNITVLRWTPLCSMPMIATLVFLISLLAAVAIHQLPGVRRLI